jgi:hypothetical protein
VRLDTSRERGTGTTGLGLAIAREIALAHHGEITLEERPGDGTRAVVTLPLKARSLSRTGRGSCFRLPACRWWLASLIGVCQPVEVVYHGNYL